MSLLDQTRQKIVKKGESFGIVRTIKNGQVGVATERGLEYYLSPVGVFLGDRVTIIDGRLTKGGAGSRIYYV